MLSKFALAVLPALSAARGLSDGSSSENAYYQSLGLNYNTHGTLNLYSWNEWDAATEQSEIHMELEISDFAADKWDSTKFIQMGVCFDLVPGLDFRAPGQRWDCANIKGDISDFADTNWTFTVDDMSMYLDTWNAVSSSPINVNDGLEFDPNYESDDPSVNWVYASGSKEGCYTPEWTNDDYDYVARCDSIKAHFWRYWTTSETEVDRQVTDADFDV